MKLSIILSNRNDLVMFNLTLNSAIESFKTLDCNAEIVVCDNSDKKFHELMPTVVPVGFQRQCHVRMYNQEQPCFTSARMRAAKEAKGEYLFCVDSHVLFGQKTLIDSVAFMDKNAEKSNLGFVHPPIRWAHQGPAAIRHTLAPAPNGTPWGSWKFMPWICRREWYLDTLKGYGSHSDHNISWGGAELLQQVKSWMLGYEQWALPTDPIIHIGPYTPEVIKTGQYKYRTYTANGNQPHGFGVLLAFYVLGGPDAGYKHAKLCEERIKNRHGISIDDYWPKACELGHAEHEWLMANKKWDYLELLEKQPWNDPS
jgi:hypothetical protein